jgi:hypothetical protein
MAIEEIRGRSARRQSPWSEEQRRVILSELEQILNHPTFKASKRCLSLLEYLIQHALSGDIDSIKERTLGVEVFGRPADYDTNIDPIVRMTANEIRKRLAQYYHEPGIVHDLTVRLNAGTYIPQFDFASAPDKAASTAKEKNAVQALPISVGKPVVVASKSSGSKSRTRRALLWAAVAICIVAAACTTYFLTRPVPTPQEQLWSPLMGKGRPIIISVGDWNYFASDPNWRESLAKLQTIMKTHEIPRRPAPTMPKEQATLPNNMTVLQTDAPMVPFVDANTAHSVSNWLVRHKNDTTLSIAPDQTYDDFQHGPVVVVGALDNPWFIILLSNFRYRYKFDPAQSSMYIEDAQNPTNREWGISSSRNFYYSSSTTDYAIITRYYNNDGGNWIMGLSGLSMHGTEAASELLTNPAYNSMIPKELLSGNKNFQIVVQTTVINGHLGTPKVIAVYTW